jgi:ribonuclease E
LRRTTESTALAILRKLEEEGIEHRVSEVSVAVPPTVAMYLLNQKRRSLLAIEDRYGMSVGIVEDPSLVPPDHRIERLKGAIARPEEEPAEAEEESEAEPTGEAEAAADREEAAKRGRRRRPRRRRVEEETQPLADVDTTAGADVDAEAVEETTEEEPGLAAEDATEQAGRRRRRRGKRGGRRRARTSDQPRGMEAATPEMSDGAPSLAADYSGDAEEARAGQAATMPTEVTDQAPTERIDAATPIGMAEGPATVDVEADDVSPQRFRRRGGSRSRKADESTEGEEEFADAVIDIPEAATVRSDPSAFGGVSTFEPAPDDAHALDATEAESSRGDDESSSGAEGASAARADEIVTVGGAHAPIEEPDRFGTPEHETAETGTGPTADAPTAFAGADDARGRNSAAKDAQMVLVGEARSPDEERLGLHLPPQVAITDTPGALHVTGEPEQTWHGQGYDDLRQSDDGRSSPAEPSLGNVVSAPPDQARPPSEGERRTEVVRVGEDGDSGGAGEPRRGWWQRLLS